MVQEKNNGHPRRNSKSHHSPDVDVVIVGAGLAGLSLARHLQLASSKSVLLIDKRSEIPPKKQKVGESLVQVGGYYFAKVLDMEEHLLHDHFMKYNLRFYFKNAAADNAAFEDYSQAYIRNFSNIPCYQLDRNVIEAELLRENQAAPSFDLLTAVQDIDIQLSENDLHEVRFTRDGRQRRVKATWVVDTTGRGRLLARQRELRESGPIRHGAAFMWVDGLVDIEKLTDASITQSRLHPHHRDTGHLPNWLATNHFMGDGFWFWVIPLRGKTSLGLVYDRESIAHDRVNSAEKLLEWVCAEFPLFSRDLPQRRNFDFTALKDFSHGCKETINSARWAMSGESSRFTDPLYSPGSDFIALHNSLIVDAILTDNRRDLRRKCWLFELLMQSLYGSLLPTYATSYDALGDQETFVLKYTWELSIYFSFFVFPFINDLESDVDFVPGYLSRFSRLGALNAKLQSFISGYYQWKKGNRHSSDSLLMHDFTAIETLCRAEKTFYQVGLSPDEAKVVLDEQVANLNELARFVVAHICSAVLGDDSVVSNRSFVDSIDFKMLEFDQEGIRLWYEQHKHSCEAYGWAIDPNALQQFRSQREESDSPVQAGELPVCR